MLDSVSLISPAPENEHRERSATRTPWRTVCSDFFVGPENALLQVALTASSPEAAHYSPVFLYGPSGVGKTHFLQAVASRFRSEHPASKAIVSSGADFARALSSATELDSLADFRAKYRPADLFVLDNLEELANRPPAQLELLHTIDALQECRRSVFVTARAAVTDLRSLLPGLRSRLGAGLTVPLSLPSPATRRVLVDELARRHQVELSAELVEILVNGTGRELPLWRTVPELRGILFQLASQQQAGEAPDDPQTAIDGLLHRWAAKPVTVREIRNQVARYYHLKSSELVGSSRRQGIVRARNMAIYLSRKLTGASYQQLGRQFGGRDHTTVLHACHRIASFLTTDPESNQAFETLTRQLLGSCPMPT